MKEKKDTLKGRKIIIYARVSTEEQKGTLSTQVAAIKKGLADLGIKQVPEVFQEQASGTKLDRPQLKRAIEAALSSKKPAAIVVRDIQRLSRDPYDLGVIYSPLRDANTPVVSINEPIVLGTRKKPQPAADLLAPILVAAGGSEVNTRLKQTLQGVERSAAKGIFAGTPLSLFPDEPFEPRRELIRLFNAGVSQTEGSRRLGKSTSWWRKNMKAIQKYEAAGVLEDWLDTIDLIRAYEQEKGEGKGPKAGIKMKIVRRMTSGYLADPTNPIVKKPTKRDLDEYFFNFNKYKPKRSK